MPRTTPNKSTFSWSNPQSPPSPLRGLLVSLKQHLQVADQHRWYIWLSLYKIVYIYKFRNICIFQYSKCECSEKEFNIFKYQEGAKQALLSSNQSYILCQKGTHFAAWWPMTSISCLNCIVSPLENIHVEEVFLWGRLKSNSTTFCTRRRFNVMHLRVH